MGLGGDSIKLLFRMEGDSSSAKKASEELKAQFAGDFKAIENSVKTAMANVGTSIASVVSPATIAVGAIASIGTAALGVSAAILSLAKSSASYASEIGAAQAKTGLSTLSLSALRYAAELAGKELSDFTNVFPKFQKLLAEAAQGSTEAAEKLQRMHIDKAAWHDQEAALEQLFKRLGELQSPIERTKLLQDALGRSGTDVAVIANKVGVSFSEFKKEVEGAGHALTDMDIKAAREFNTAYRKISIDVDNLKYQFGKEFLPVLKKVFETFEDYLKDNQKSVHEWGQGAANVFSNVLDALKQLVQFYTDHPILASILPGGPAVQTVRNLAANGPYSQPKPGSRDQIEGRTPPPGPGDPDYDANLKAQQEHEKELQDLAKRDAAAQIEILKGQLAESLKLYETYSKTLADRFEKNSNRTEYTANLNTAFDLFKSEADKLLPLIDAAEKKAASLKGTTAKELELLNQQQKDRVTNLVDTTQKIQDDANKRLLSEQKKTDEKAIEQAKKKVEQLDALAKQNTDRDLLFLQNELDAKAISEYQYAQRKAIIDLALLTSEREHATEKAKQDLLDIEIGNKKLQIQHDLFVAEGKAIEQIKEEGKAYLDRIAAEEKEKAKHQLPSTDLPRPVMHDDKGRPMFDRLGNAIQYVSAAIKQLTDRWKDFRKELEKSVGIGNIVASLGNMGLDFLQNMIDATGQAVEGWVLYGDSIGKALKKALASELAHVAAKSTIKALEATALGFLRLAEYDFVGAGHAFASAGLWAALAGASAIAGRLVAGDSFKQTSNTAAGSNPSSPSSSTTNAHGNSVYSTQADQTIDQSRNVPGSNGAGPGQQQVAIPIKLYHQIDVRLNGDGVLEILRNNVRVNGPIRELIQNAAVS